jgi:uncharacterized protein YcfJ
MKCLSAVVGLTLALTAAQASTALAQQDSQPGYSKTSKCFKDEYREEYVPGTKEKPGYVKKWSEKVEIPCKRPTAAEGISPKRTASEKVDDNSCIEGSVIGGLLGAGAGAALSRGNGRWIGVPVGAAAGALVGCQVDGG